MLLTYLGAIILTHLVKLVDQVFNPKEANFFVEFINQLLIIDWEIRVAIPQVIQNVAEMCSISINEVSPIFISADIVPA